LHLGGNSLGTELFQDLDCRTYPFSRYGLDLRNSTVLEEKRTKNILVLGSFISQESFIHSHRGIRRQRRHCQDQKQHTQFGEDNRSE